MLREPAADVICHSGCASPRPREAATVGPGLALIIRETGTVILWQATYTVQLQVRPRRSKIR